MTSLMPAFIASITVDDRQKREYRVRIPGLTDGAPEMPRAELMSAIGDRSEQTEVRIKVDDRVWLAFHGGDTRFPVIVGFRDRHDGANELDWRRFEHANFEFLADNVFRVIAGVQCVVQTPLALIDAAQSHITGDVQVDGNMVVDGLLTFNNGMQGKSGTHGGPAMVISGGAAFSEDVVAEGVSVATHGHTEQGDGNRVSNPTP